MVVAFEVSIPSFDFSLDMAIDELFFLNTIFIQCFSFFFLKNFNAGHVYV